LSAKIFGLVWELELPREEKYVLLCLADHADHEGNNVFPSIGLIAWKTDYSERRIQELMRRLERRGLLVKVEENFGRGKTIKYQINLPAGKPKEPRRKGAKISPISRTLDSGKGAVGRTERVRGSVVKGELATAPESIEPKALNLNLFPPTPQGGFGLTSRDRRNFFKELNRIYGARQGSVVCEEDAIRTACVNTGTPFEAAKGWVALSYGEKAG
jgi:helix-turn-helix protein